jgi:hypothetical protein
MEKSRNLPIIIGGFYRSGTTLVRRLIDSHSRIHCGPEVKFFKDFYGDYLYDDLHHVRLFKTLSTLGLTEQEMLAIFGRAFVESHELAARKSGKVRWADKNPENVLYLQQWEQMLPEGFLFLHVVRDPLDALASLKEIGFAKAVPADFSGKVRLFKAFREAGDQFLVRHPLTSLTIHYEQIVQFPDTSLEAIFSWLGEQYEADVLQNFNLPERGEGIEDPKIRTTESVHSQSVGRWREILTKMEVDIAREILEID